MDVKIRRLEPVTARYFIEGFPGVGLAGLIASKYIISKRKMRPVAFVVSEAIPPTVTVLEGEILAPITVYGDNEAYIAVAESFIPPSVIPGIASALFEEFVDSKNVELGISLGGSAAIPPPSGTERVVSFIATTERSRKIASELGLREIKRGVIMGITAALVSEAYMRREDYLVLLAESDPMRPDPVAALALIEALNKLLGRDVDTAELRETVREVEEQHREIHNHIKEQLKKSGVDEMSHLYYVRALKSLIRTRVNPMPLTPVAALEKSLGKEIIVSLKDGTLLKGYFESYDMHMNIRLRDASVIDREENVQMSFKNVVIRGSRLLRIRVVIRIFFPLGSPRPR